MLTTAIAQPGLYLYAIHGIVGLAVLLALPHQRRGRSVS
jgi:hypothetical protein